MSDDQWTRVERTKLNADALLMFNDISVYDLDVRAVDRSGDGEKTSDISDRSDWGDPWDIEGIRGFPAGVYPQWEKETDERVAEFDPMFGELSNAMGGPRKVGFPVCSILATEK